MKGVIREACRYVCSWKAENLARLCYVGLVPNIPSILERRNPHTTRLPTRPILSPSVSFCESHFDTDITVWIRPRLLSSGLEFVGKRFPFGVAGRQPVLEYVSMDDMTELTMYSLPPVRVFQPCGRREPQD